MDTNILTTVKDTMQWMDWITIFFSFGAMLFSIINWKKEKKQFEEIKIKLEFEDKVIRDIPSYILRKDFSRAEIKGILRGLDENESYKIDYIDNPKSTFLKDILEVQKGKQEFIIPITYKDDFDLKE